MYLCVCVYLYLNTDLKTSGLYACEILLNYFLWGMVMNFFSVNILRFCIIKCADGFHII